MEAAYEDFLEDRTLIESVGSPGFVDDLREWLAETADDDRVIYLVAVDPDDVIGFIQVLAGEDETPEHVDPGEAFLKTLYVLPGRWNEGVWSALLDAGLERLPEDVTGWRSPCFVETTARSGSTGATASGRPVRGRSRSAGVAIRHSGSFGTADRGPSPRA